MIPPKFYLIHKVFLLLIFITPIFSQTPSQLFQLALLKENGEGNLISAIELYEQIVSDETADLEIRAKALMHVGMCYEKLGKQEALKAYQLLIKDYPGQKNEVAIARERLNSLLLIAEKVSETPLLPKFTKLEIPTELSWSVKLSPDGKDLALVSDKKLWKMPLSGNLGPNFSGTPVQLNTEGIEVGWWGLSWSGDGKWIAFNERPLDNKPSQKIFIVSSDGGKPKKIASPKRFSSEPIVNLRLSLSPEGKELAFSSVDNDKKHVYTKQVNGGSTKQLVDFQAREPAFSPDGKMIAFAGENPGSSEGELGLWIITPQGGTPHLLADAGNASSPVWSPDGKMVAFLDYNRGKQINIISVSSGGEAVGKVNTIDVPEGIKEVRLLAGWTPDNKIGALFTTNQKFALYTVPSDGGQAAIILKDTYALQPRWSSDNNKIHYTASVDEDNQSWKKRGLAVVSVEGGKGSILTRKKDAKIGVPFGYQAGNRVSPDGKMIVSAAKLPNASDFMKNYPCTQIWKIPIDGSNPIKITNPQDPYTDIGPCWSPDGKKVAFQRLELVKGNGEEIFGDGGGIYIVDSSGGEPKFLISKSGQYFNSLVWSPDGKMIAYLSADKKGINPNAINVINVSNNETRVVGKVTAADVNIELAWSPDSKRIAFNSFGNVIKVMSLSDGSIEQISTALKDVRIHHLDWSPDGKRFVFGGGKGGKKEFWLLEDFLPVEK